MRKDWKIKKLKDCCKVFADGDWIESKNQSNDGIRLIQTGNIGLGLFKNNKDKARFISEYTYNKLKCTEVKANDLLVSRLPHPVGRSCIIPDLNSKMITSVDCTIIRPKNFLLSEFLKYYQCSNEYFFDIENRTTGTTRQRISRKNLGLIQIPIPPLSEQKQIVALLDKAFAAIDQAKANIEKNIENARELFQSKKENIFNNLKIEKGHRPLTSLCKEIFAGGDAPKTQYTKERTSEYTIPIFGNAIKNKGLYGFAAEARVTQPSITISARGSGTGHTEIRTEPFYPIVRLIVLTPDTDLINLEFFKYSIQNLDILRSGSAIPQLTVPMIKRYSIPTPEIKYQKIIVEQLNKLENTLEEYRNLLLIKLSQLEELKKSILEKAFSGELTVFNRDLQDVLDAPDFLDEDLKD